MATMLIDGSKENACRQAEANAIRAKTGGSAQINYDFANGKGFADAIAAIPTGGGGGTPGHGVFFLDYDGSTVEAWASDDVAGKSALPSNPSHTGLVAQGWNWDLTHIKSYIASYPDANVYVGQMYRTASGLTEFDITVTKVTGLTVTCKMSGNKNWGDGTTDSLTTHTYANYGSYTITCDGTTIPAGSSSTGGVFGSSISNMNRYWCTAVRVGGSVTSIGSYAFYYCYSLTSITIPQGATSIDRDTFYDCYSLTSITIPSSVTRIGSAAFEFCYSLTSITIPQGVTSFSTNTFDGCYSLTSITIPQGVTSVDSSMFYNCYSLTSITIPSSVTIIYSKVFYRCYSILEYDFTAMTSVPSLSNIDSFTDINGNCKIKVPAALYDSWIAASNWSTYADYIEAV